MMSLGRYLLSLRMTMLFDLRGPPSEFLRFLRFFPPFPPCFRISGFAFVFAFLIRIIRQLNPEAYAIHHPALPAFSRWFFSEPAGDSHAGGHTHNRGLGIRRCRRPPRVAHH